MAIRRCERCRSYLRHGIGGALGTRWHDAIRNVGEGVVEAAGMREVIALPTGGGVEDASGPRPKLAVMAVDASSVTVTPRLQCHRERR